MSISSHKINKILRDEPDPVECRNKILDLANNSVVGLLPHVDKIAFLFDTEDLRNRIRAILTELGGAHGPFNYLKYLNQMRHVLEDAELRDLLLKIHAIAPWRTYTAVDQIRQLFHNDYFRDLLRRGVQFSEDRSLLQIFLLTNASVNFAAFDNITQAALSPFIEAQGVVNFAVLGHKDPGFACGGLEDNYRGALRAESGLCEVNGYMLAKLFHRKNKGGLEGLKVSLLARDTRETPQGQVIWRDFVYAPAEGCHHAVMDAIEARDRHLELPTCYIKACRPLINYTSEEVFSTWDARF